MYEDYFSLSGAPFRLNPDPKFFYGSRSHNKAMAYLHYGVRQAEGFIVVTGEIGAGKSILIGHLLDQLNRSNVIAANLLTSNLEPSDLLAHILSAFRISAEGGGKSGELEAFEEFLYDQLERGRRVLLVVDEAQNLPPRTIEELRMLSNMDYEGTPLFQVFLVGQPEFREILAGPNMEQLRQRVIASYHLEPLGETETRNYIEHRLSVVGWREDPTISDDAFSLIFKESGGVPRRINTLFNRLLLFCALEKRHEIDASTVASVANELRTEGFSMHEQGMDNSEETKLLTDEGPEEEIKVDFDVDSADQQQSATGTDGNVVVAFNPDRSKEKVNPAKGVRDDHGPQVGVSDESDRRHDRTVKGKVTQGIKEESVPSEGDVSKEDATEGKSDTVPVAEKTTIDHAKEQVTANDHKKQPAERVVSPSSEVSAFDRLRSLRRPSSGPSVEQKSGAITEDDIEEATVTVDASPSPATLSDVASAIAAVEAASLVDSPHKESDPNEVAKPPSKFDIDDWRRSLVQSINGTRDELKLAHENVASLRRKLNTIEAHHRKSREKIATRLARAESLLSEIRDVWR